MKASSTLKALALAAPISAVAAHSADAAYDAFLKIEGVDGESSSERFDGNIDVYSWSWGMRINDDRAPEVDTLTIVRRVDRASPQLMLKVLHTIEPTRISLAMTQSDEEERMSNKFFDMTLDNIYVREVKIKPASELFPSDTFDEGTMLEQVTFGFIGSGGGSGKPSILDIKISHKDEKGFFGELENPDTEANSVSLEYDGENWLKIEGL